MTTSPIPTVAGSAPARSTWRHVRTVLLLACYVLLSLWALALSGFGPVLAVTGALPDPSLRFTAVAAGGFKVLTSGAAVAVLWSRGRSVLAVRALLAGQLVWCVADLLAPQADESTGQVLGRFVASAAIWVGPWLLLSPDRRRLWSEPIAVRRLPAALSVLAAAPLLVWAVTNAGLDASAPLPDGGSYAELRYDLTGLPLALLVGLVIASLHESRAWATVLSVVSLVVGVLALAYPDAYGSPGPAGAALVVLAGAVAWSGRVVGGRPTS